MSKEDPSDNIWQRVILYFLLFISKMIPKKEEGNDEKE